MRRCTQRGSRVNLSIKLTGLDPHFDPIDPTRAICEVGARLRPLLRRARQEPARRVLGIEVADKYFRLVRRRMRRWELTNVVLLRGEALYLLAACLPSAFADAVHVYFPDPWRSACCGREERSSSPPIMSSTASWCRPSCVHTRG